MWFELRSFSLVASALATSGVTGGAKFCGNMGVGGTRFGLAGGAVEPCAVTDVPLPGEVATGFVGFIRAKKKKHISILFFMLNICFFIVQFKTHLIKYIINIVN